MSRGNCITWAVFGLLQYRVHHPLTVLAISAYESMMHVCLQHIYSVYDIVSMPATRADVYSQYVPICHMWWVMACTVCHTYLAIPKSLV